MAVWRSQTFPPLSQLVPDAQKPPVALRGNCRPAHHLKYFSLVYKSQALSDQGQEAKGMIATRPPEGEGSPSDAGTIGRQPAAGRGSAKHPAALHSTATGSTTALAAAD